MLPVCDFQNEQWKGIPLHYKGEDFIFPYLVPTKEVFNCDPAWLIRWKCFCLTGATPLATAGRVVSSSVKTVFLSFYQIFNYLDGSDFDSSSIKGAAKEVFRAAKYGCLLTQLALKGIFNPYNSRAEYGLYERKLNHHIEKSKRDRFYLAVCFQPKAKISPNEDNALEVQRVLEKLEKHAEFIKKVEKLKASFFAGDIQKTKKVFLKLLSLHQNYRP